MQHYTIIFLSLHLGGVYMGIRNTTVLFYYPLVTYVEIVVLLLQSKFGNSQLSKHSLLEEGSNSDKYRCFSH